MNVAHSVIFFIFLFFTCWEMIHSHSCCVKCAFVFIVVELYSHFSCTHLAHKVPNALFSHLGDGKHFYK